MKTLILSWLLHHANKQPEYKDPFYAIKKRILDYYGKPAGNDIQIIPGKKCWTCDGTGIYTGYYWQSGEKWYDTCNRCWRGWYISPKFTVLNRVKFGPYVFHQPFMTYDHPESIPVQYRVDKENQIQGYKDFVSSAWTTEAHFWLFWLFDKASFRRLWRTRRFSNSQMGLIITAHRLKRYCINEYQRRREHLDFGQLPEVPKPKPVYVDDDLPF
ncbi:hypothetical protein [Spirosoma oryzicola]|uniref:hypothetical protein n=1 Tax=Spirosoma oryzicola TaxID=2898794 RepID=UPI001E3C49C1|nr:hypothetical protein [Spirosoma oryzicola]UHG93289.1 hypothetical protein LQ777_10390 [Spirosoma oryzicola]